MIWMSKGRKTVKWEQCNKYETLSEEGEIRPREEEKGACDIRSDVVEMKVPSDYLVIIRKRRVASGVKQGYVLAPMLFSMMFSVMLSKDFNEDEHGIKLSFVAPRGYSRSYSMCNSYSVVNCLIRWAKPELLGSKHQIIYSLALSEASLALRQMTIFQVEDQSINMDFGKNLADGKRISKAPSQHLPPAPTPRPPPPPTTGTPSDKANSIQSRPLPSPPKFTAQDSPNGQYENGEEGWMEDYHYVHLQGKEEFEKTQKELLERGSIIGQGKGQLEQQQLKQFECLQQEVSRPIDHDLSNWMPSQPLASGWPGGLGPSDQQLLLFYLEQCEANLTTLTNAVDAFFTAVATNQPPKIFVAHSKFVILSAHKLVFIGDTLSRQAKALDIWSQVTHYSNLLCDMLKEIVVTTKMAALQYPSPTATQDMVDCMKVLGQSTQQFRRVLGQLAAA
ncbi:breast cancer anti-estrogen resistance protein 1-like [Petaurus breviceps papuanus]|uniref:breast cancer anti-estrogen resistance protein 1-like n=1 Tax=Petaurus breviceps papuanus TaxID=3040969 RepID=UPI0036DD9522